MTGTAGAYGQGRVTLADVAVRAGVHPGTASRALNPRYPGLVSAETADRVSRAAAALGYQPDLMARGLRTRHSATIGVLVPSITDPAFPQLLEGIQQGLAASDCAALPASTSGGLASAIAWMRARRADGLIAISDSAEPVIGIEWPAGQPLVTISTRPGRGEPGVCVDHDRGAELLLDHLTQLGHRRIGVITLDPGPAIAPSLTPVTLAAATASADTTAEGARCCRELLARFPACTAIAAASDLLAAGCCAELARTGLSCPREMSVTGWGDTQASAAAWPPLTTIRLPWMQAGEQSARILLSAITSGRPAASPLVLAPEIVTRASTAAWPGQPGSGVARRAQSS